MSVLDKIKSPNDLKKLNIKKLNQLASEIRGFLIDKISKNGGHLASNLGVVELTIAIHKVFDSPKDKIIWDVGHQSYVHKILTNRKDNFSSIRKINGLSGFPKNTESEHDVFETGHSSTSLSAGLGMALARDIKKENHEVISVIGDGAMTAGMAFEALNHNGDIQSKQIIILNDNEMSISKNVGAIARYLNKIRLAKKYYQVKHKTKNILKESSLGVKSLKFLEIIKDKLRYMILPGIFFEELGFKYFGPIDGHNIEELLKILEKTKKRKEPIIIHVLTQKGKGYKPAEKNPDNFHGVSSFDIDSGEFFSSGETYSHVLGETLSDFANKNKKIIAITAAMPKGTGLENFRKKFPNRFFDVGIAEQHGVTLASGLAKEGFKPFFAVYSSFLQRAYDQIIHDVCLQNLDVVFAIDRAGLVGEDGETHQGIFDISFLSHIPNLTIISPRDKNEFIAMIKYSLEHKGPLAIRYSRGLCFEMEKDEKLIIKYGECEIIQNGNKILIIAIGDMIEEAMKFSRKFKDKVMIINARFIKPIDKKIIELAINFELVITMENNIFDGGFSSIINNELIKTNFSGKIKNISLPNKFIEQGTIEELKDKYIRSQFDF